MTARILAIFLAVFTISIPAMGYIDPGSGSVIMSAIIGFFVAAGMAIKTYWYKLKSLFSPKKKTPAAANSPMKTEEGAE